MDDMPRRSRAEIFFGKVTEARHGYFVEYRPPPSPNTPFATLGVIFHEALPSADAIARILEQEARAWLARYPITIMASAFDDRGTLCDLSPARTSDHVFAFMDAERNESALSWRLVKEAELPRLDLSPGNLTSVYAGIPYKTRSNVDANVKKARRLIKVGWLIVFVWAVVVPATIAILGWASVVVGAVTTVYALWQALVQALKLLGKWPKSKRERERETEELAMRHHDYHCRANPEGFMRLKLENFERWERERIQQDAAAARARSAR